MTAHNPITAAKAVAMIEAIGIADARRLLADHAAAGLVKSYALVIETAEVGKLRQQVRGGAVSLELWRRVISENAAADVWTGGTVRLAASGFIGGPPEVSATGFEFERKGVARLIDRLRGREPKALGCSPKLAHATDDTLEPASRSPQRRRQPDPDAIPLGALLVTINQTMAALGLGRTKVYDLAKVGRLERVEIGGGVRITAASIRALAGVGSRPAERSGENA